MAREDKFTIQKKSYEVYSDFTTNFDMNPFTGSLAKVTNEDAIKQSLKNIMRTMEGERFYNTRKGSYIWNSMFEPYDPSSLELLRLKIIESCAWEPRAIIRDVRFNASLDENAYDVTIVFSTVNVPDQFFDLTITINRVR